MCSQKIKYCTANNQSRTHVPIVAQQFWSVLGLVFWHDAYTFAVLSCAVAYAGFSLGGHACPFPLLPPFPSPLPCLPYPTPSPGGPGGKAPRKFFDVPDARRWVLAHFLIHKSISCYTGFLALNFWIPKWTPRNKVTYQVLQLQVCVCVCVWVLMHFIP